MASGAVHRDNEQPGTSKGCTAPTATATVPKKNPKLIDFQDENELESHIMENLNSYLDLNSAPSHTQFLTSNQNKNFRAFEIKDRDLLRKLFFKNELAKAEVLQTFESNILSFPPDLLQVRLRKLIQDTDNPSTFDELMDRMTEILGEEEEEIDFSDIEDVDEGSWESAGTADADADAESIGRAVDESPERIDHESIPPNQTAHCGPNPTAHQSRPKDGEEEEEEFQEIPATPEDSQGHSTASSDEIFQTPFSHMVGDEPTKSRLGAKQQRVPEVPPQPQPLPPAPIFQFRGDPAKEPRLIKPGEILFSATGSPIAIPPVQPQAPSQASSTNQNQPDSTDNNNIGIGTPLLNGGVSGKPVRLRVENPNGRPLQVDLVYRGGGAEDLEVFRNFVTDVRGFVTTRSMMQNKLMAPRIPNSGTKGHSKKRSYASATASARKPMWRN